MPKAICLHRVSCFSTARANQQALPSRLVEGGDASGNDATMIGKCVVPDLRPAFRL